VLEMTDIESEIINTVVQRFVNLRQSTTRKELVRKFKNIEALNAALKGPYFGTYGQDRYVPLPHAFQYCGDQDSLTRAKRATEIVLHVLQNLDEAYPEKETGGFKLEEFLVHAAKMFDPKPAESVLTLGLYLAQYFNVLSQYHLQQDKPDVLTWFTFNERIVTIEPAKAWDEYIAESMPITEQSAPTLKVDPEEPDLVDMPSEFAQPAASQSAWARNHLRREPGPARIFRSAFDEYKFIEQRGCGGSGTVFEVQNSAGERLALKTLNANVPRTKVSRFKNEIQFCSQPPSNRIVRVLDYGRTDEGSPFYVMPLYSSTLRDRIRNGIAVAEVIPLYSQILDGVEAAHLLRIYHRDIKPENILSDPVTGLVLADFGIAHFQEDQLLTTVETGPNERLANFAYAAPEQRLSGRAIDHRADIYAVGLILNEMFTQQVAHGTGFRRIRDVAPDYAYLDDLVDLMIQQQPTQRPESIRVIKEELIGRGNEFIERQRLDELKRRAVPESHVDDPIISDPIRVVDKVSYSKGILILKLNRAVNRKFAECFSRRATRFSVNVSSAMISLHEDTARVIVTEHFLQEGVNFLKEYLILANEEYAAQIRKEHQQRIEQSRAALKMEIAQAEARARVLKKVNI
jgi:hypothetical protein